MRMGAFMITVWNEYLKHPAPRAAKGGFDAVNVPLFCGIHMWFMWLGFPYAKDLSRFVWASLICFYMSVCTMHGVYTYANYVFLLYMRN